MTAFVWTTVKYLAGAAMLATGAAELGPEAADIAARIPVAVAVTATTEAGTRWAGLLAVLPVGWALAAAVCIGRPPKPSALTEETPAAHRRGHATVACHRRATLARSREVTAYRNLMECRLDRLDSYLAGACPN